MAKEIRRIDRTQSIKLIIWVQNNKVMIEQEKPSYRKLSRLVSVELQAEIAPSSLPAIVREIIPGYEPRKIGTPGVKTAYQEWRATKEKEVQDLTRRVGELEETVIKLMDNLEAVRKLAAGKLEKTVPATSVTNPKTLPIANLKQG